MSITIPSFQSPFTIKELHLLINRCDVIKDAVKTKESVNNYDVESTLFARALESLFPRTLLPNDIGSNTRFEKIIKAIEQTVLSGKFQSGALGQDPESIVTLKMDKALKNLLKRDIKKSQKTETESDFDEQCLPSTYQFAFHDTSDSPYLIQAGIKNILTPGSYIDPAERDKNGKRDPANNGITKLTQYGFADMEFKWTWQGVNCVIDINMPSQAITIHDTRGENHMHIETDPPTTDYFGGNTEKNTWFNDPNNANDLESAKKYLLCKELGDTTQATFARALFDDQNTPYNASTGCIFTNDMVLTTRAKLLEIPCCVKEHATKEISAAAAAKGERHRRLLFFRPLGDPTELLKARNQLALDECRKHNMAVKASITRIFTTGFYIGDQQYTTTPPPRWERSLNENQYLNPRVEGYFRSIQVIIDHINGILDRIDPKADPVPSEEEFRQLMAFCKVNHIFKLREKKKPRKGKTPQKGKTPKKPEDEFELIQSVKYLFLYDDPAQNPIYANFLERFNVPSATRTSQTETTIAENFGDVLITPSLDCIANFRRMFSEYPTIYNQFVFLTRNKPDYIRKRIQEALAPASATPTPVPELAAPSGGSRSRTTRSRSRSPTARKTSPWKITKDFEDFKTIYELSEVIPGTGLTHLYDMDTIDLLWILLWKLRIGRAMDHFARLNYMENYLFFLYPYFQFVGEACFDIKHLQAIHDRFYVGMDHRFSAIVGYYVQHVFLPRNRELQAAGELALQTNQHVFLRRFMAEKKYSVVIRSSRKTAKTARGKTSRRKTAKSTRASMKSKLISRPRTVATTGISTMA